MKLLSWNCQGLVNPWIGRSLHNIAREQVPNVCFLMETRLDREGFDRLYGELPYPHKIIVKKLDTGGRLALIWKEGVVLDLINYTDNHILVKVKEEDGLEWWLACFYGWPEANLKYKSWELLEHLKTFVGDLGCALVILMQSFSLQKSSVKDRLKRAKLMLSGFLGGLLVGGLGV